MTWTPRWLRFLPLRLCSVLVTLLLAAADPAQGQTSSGTISGRVVDSTDQPVPGATVTLIKSDTGASQTLTTDRMGEFVFASIQPGIYNLTVDLQGFKQSTRENINVVFGQTISVDGGASTKAVFGDFYRGVLQTPR